jgi:hypothetical protein
MLDLLGEPAAKHPDDRRERAAGEAGKQQLTVETR